MQKRSMLSTSLKTGKIKNLSTTKSFTATASDHEKSGIVVTAEGKLVHISETLTLLTGYSAEELQQMNYLELVHPDERQEANLIMQEVVATGMAHACSQRRLITKNNDVLKVLAIKSVPGYDNYQGRFLLELVAISPKLRASYATTTNLMTTIERSGVQSTFGAELIRILSHDILGPLATLSAVTGYLQQQNWSADNQELTNQIHPLSNLILSSTQHLGKSLNNIFLTQETQPVSIEAAIQHSAGFLRLTPAQQELIEQKLVIDEILMPAGSLEKILTEMIANSFRFQHPDKNLAITIQSELCEKGVNIFISDNGLGIDLSMYEDEIFGFRKPFHQGISGEGLGLFHTRVLIEAAGGKIKVDSTVGEGSIFSIFLPG